MWVPVPCVVGLRPCAHLLLRVSSMLSCFSLRYPASHDHVRVWSCDRQGPWVPRVTLAEKDLFLESSENSMWRQAWYIDLRV